VTGNRSWLFTPGTRPDRFARAAERGADVLIIDLEDAVTPADKPAARANALAYCRTAPLQGRRAIRINALDTRAGLADLEMLLSGAPVLDYVILPKTESAAHLRILDRLLVEAGQTARLIALIESARGLADVREIASATPRQEGLMFGAGDMAADLGAAASWEPLLPARAAIVLACAVAGIAAIDSPFFALGDESGLAREIAAAAAMGFGAKAAIHPGQVAAINAALTPSEAEIAQARRILAACDAGVGVVDGRMVDAAMARKARRLVGG
jgi:(S)-citramalyl-CoA lyase